MASSLDDRAAQGPAISGIVRGASIELNSPTGLPEGQRVIVTILPVDLPIVDGKVQCEGVWRSLGSWAAAGPEFDEWMAEREAKRAAARRIVGEEWASCWTPTRAPLTFEASDEFSNGSCSTAVGYSYRP